MPTPSKPLPPVSELRRLFDYNAETGLLTWKVNASQRSPKGSIAGSKGKHSVVVEISAFGGKFLVHRIAWALMTGADPGRLEIDHANRNPHDNRWENLRLATHGQNVTNRYVPSQRGLPKGVSLRRGHSSKPYQARIQKPGGKRQSLGYYATADEAHQAYLTAAAELHGEFACGGAK